SPHQIANASVMSLIGTKLPIPNVRYCAALGSIADITRTLGVPNRRRLKLPGGLGSFRRGVARERTWPEVWVWPILPKKDFWRGRPNGLIQDRFQTCNLDSKNSPAWILSFQFLIPQSSCADFFDSIDPKQTNRQGNCSPAFLQDT